MPSDELSFFYPALSTDQSDIDTMRYALSRREPPLKPVNYEQTKEIPTPENIAYGNYLAEQEALRRQSQIKSTTPQGQFMERVIAPFVEPAMSIGTGMVSMPLAAGESLAKTGVTKALELANIITPAQRAELLAKTPSIEQQIAARTYEPRSELGKENLLTAMQMFEASKLPHAWPTAGGRAPTRPMLTPEDVRAMGGQAAKLKQEVRDIPIDFPNAREGAIKLDQFGEPTVGAKLGVVANKAESVGKTLDLPGLTDEPPVGAVKLPGGQLLVPKPVGDISPNKIDIPVGVMSKMQQRMDPFGLPVGESPTTGALMEKYLSTFFNNVDNPIVEPLRQSFHDYRKQRIFDLFPDATQTEAAEAFSTLYSPEQRHVISYQFLNDFIKAPETQAAAQALGVTLPTIDEYTERVNAARQWVTGPMTQYVQKFVGTEKDPLLQLAEKGITHKAATKLIESVDGYIDGYPTVIERMRNFRQQLGKDPDGSYKQQIADKTTALNALQNEYRELSAQRRALGDEILAENPNRDPASDPRYAATTNPILAKEREVTRALIELDNLKLADRFETITDAAIVPRTAESVKKELDYVAKLFFPGIEKIPESETLYDINRRAFEVSGLLDVGAHFVRDIMNGTIPVNKIKDTPIAKFIEKIATSRIKKEREDKLKEVRYIADLQNKLLNDANNLPTASKFGNITAITLDSSYPKSEIARILAADTEVLDHCVASGGPGGTRKHFLTGSSRNHEPVVNPITGAYQSKFSEEQLPRYIRSVEQGESQIVSIRDNATGYPVATIELHATEKQFPSVADVTTVLNKYVDRSNVLEFLRVMGDHGLGEALIRLQNNLGATRRAEFDQIYNEISQLPYDNLFTVGYANGFQNGRIEKNYLKGVLGYLNANGNRIIHPGSALEESGIYDTLASPSTFQELAREFRTTPATIVEALRDMPRFILYEELSKVVEDLKTQQMNAVGANEPVMQGALVALQKLINDSEFYTNGNKLATKILSQPESLGLENYQPDVLKEIANTFKYYDSFNTEDLLKEFKQELGRRQIMQLGGTPEELAAKLIMLHFNTQYAPTKLVTTSVVSDNVLSRPAAYGLENIPIEVRRQLADKIEQIPERSITIKNLQNALLGTSTESETPTINRLFIVDADTLDDMRNAFDPDNPLEMLYEPFNTGAYRAYERALESIIEDATNPGEAIDKLREYARNILDDSEHAERFFDLATDDARIVTAKYLNSHAQIIEEHLGPADAPTTPAQLPAPAQGQVARAEFIRTGVEAFDRYFDANNGFTTPETYQLLVDLLQRATYNPDSLPGVQPQVLGPNGLETLRVNLETLLISRSMDMDPLQYINQVATAITDMAAATGNYTMQVPMLRLQLQGSARQLYDDLISSAGRIENINAARQAIDYLVDRIDQHDIDISQYPDLENKFNDLITNEGFHENDAYQEALAYVRHMLNEQTRALNLLEREQNPPQDIFARGGLVKKPTLAQMRAEMLLRNNYA